MKVLMLNDGDADEIFNLTYVEVPETPATSDDFVKAYLAVVHSESGLVPDDAPDDADAVDDLKSMRFLVLDPDSAPPSCDNMTEHDGHDEPIFPVDAFGLTWAMLQKLMRA